MTKAVICVACSDILAPYYNWETNRDWRWCQCGQVAGRWLDGAKGILEVTTLNGPRHARVLGLNNAFLVAAVQGQPYGEPEAIHEEWRLLHDTTCEEVAPRYLFSERKRQCWAVIIRPGETGDVRYVDYAEAIAQATPAPAPVTAPRLAR